MPGLIDERGTTYNLPNYHGELMQLTPDDAPFLSAIGGLQGGKRATGTTETEWSAYDLRDPEDRQRIEGADAPDSELRTRFNLGNVLEIHQEKVDVSYTKLAARNQYAGANIGGNDNAVPNELPWQLTQQVKTKKLDVEHSFLVGSYAKPDDNRRPRRTRGIVEAIKLGAGGTANVIEKGTLLEDVTVTIANDRFAKGSHGLRDGTAVAVVGGAALGFSEREVYYVVGTQTGYFSLATAPDGRRITPLDDGTADVVALEEIDSEDANDLLQLVWENGGIRVGETATLIVGAAGKRWVTREFITKAGFQESSRSVGGVNCMTFETDFGRLNVMLSRIIHKHALTVVSLEQCNPAFLEVPGKGVFFAEPLAKTGASEKVQLYGEIGLEYGNPLAGGIMSWVRL